MTRILLSRYTTFHYRRPGSGNGRRHWLAANVHSANLRAWAVLTNTLRSTHRRLLNLADSSDTSMLGNWASCVDLTPRLSIGNWSDYEADQIARYGEKYLNNRVGYRSLTRN